MIYLACPYNHEARHIRLYRFSEVNRVAAELMYLGEIVFSPISHSHPIAEAGGLPLDFDYWKTFDEWFISRCDKVVVLKLPGWKESVGVKAEVLMAIRLGKDVEYMKP